MPFRYAAARLDEDEALIIASDLKKLFRKWKLKRCTCQLAVADKSRFLGESASAAIDASRINFYI
jgi:hypothetical protein